MTDPTSPLPGNKPATPEPSVGKTKKPGEESPPPDRPRTLAPKTTVHNLTARRIGITSSRSQGVEFVLPPFGRREVAPQTEARFDFAAWAERDLINFEREAPPVEGSDNRSDLAIGCLFWVVLLGVPVGVFVPPLQTNPWYWGVLAVIVIGVSLYGFVKANWAKLLRQFWQWLTQWINLLMNLGVGIGLPAAVILFFGGGLQLFVPDQDRYLSLALLGRLLQWALISIASILPAGLYFLFDRQRLGTLRESFFRDITILDPTVETLNDARSIHGTRVEEIYGPDDKSGGGDRFLSGTRWPIFVATLVVTHGWILALSPFGKPEPITTLAQVLALLVPQWTPVNLGFLGAYFFAINMILRRYLLADLKPKAYSHITVRILAVIVLVWVLSLIPDLVGNTVTAVGDAATTVVSSLSGAPAAAQPAATSPQPGTAEQEPASSQPGPLLLILAFFVGIVPETGTAIIQEYLRSQKFLADRIPSLQEKLPLNDLEGVNLYNRARLLDEGIENIENLAHHDLIDLLLQTRIPLPRLVDWVDQGILYLHIVDVTEVESQSTAEAQKKTVALQKLRLYGIRTATDLERVYDAAKRRDARGGKAGPDSETRRLLGLLNDANEKVQRVRTILDCIADDEWMVYIRNWRDLSRFHDKTWTLEEVGTPNPDILGPDYEPRPQPSHRHDF